MSIKILIADDEFHFRELVSDFLTNEGYEVITAEDGAAAIDLFFSNKDINLVILDVMMPQYTGWEVCKKIRKHSETPIMMLTALGDQNNEINGLNLGADEYISKPFSYEIFIARVNSLLRRAKKEKEEIIEIKGLLINESNHTVSVNNNTLELSPKEYELILFFVKNSGRALSRDQILNSVWGYDFFGDRRTVDTHVKKIRFKLEEYGEFIRTVRGLGYIFEVK